MKIESLTQRIKPEQQRSKTVSLGSREIEINPDFEEALDIMERTDDSVFITGKAGTGKSTLLEYFRANSQKKIAVLAPTGVAALNVRGQTIHSFFQFSPGVTVQEAAKQRISQKQKAVIERLDCIVVDEVSMVRADLLDCMDLFLRRLGPSKYLPFGGIQMVFIGDLYQLPPVIAGRDEQRDFLEVYESPYFFSARVFEKLDLRLLELQKIYRQRDEEFISLLNKIRTGYVDDQDLALLNKRQTVDFVQRKNDFYITLTPTNAAADQINEIELSRLPGKTRTYQSQINGSFERSATPTQIDLSLKQGAQIMLLNNDKARRWVNGSLGEIKKIKDGKGEINDILKIKLQSGRVVDVEPYTWEMYRYFYNKKTKNLDVEVVGSFTQYPLRLAWAVTIHKSQGKTFDNVIFDIDRGTFSPGQVYVALSRCRSLEGIFLKKAIEAKHIWTDYGVTKFLTRYQYDLSEKAVPLVQKTALLEEAIEKGKAVIITYLKPNNERSKRVIEPSFVGEMEYEGIEYFGVEGFCRLRQDNRVFRVDRILNIELSEE